MTLSRRIARLEADGPDAGTCVCPADTPELREAAARRFVEAVLHRIPHPAPLVCPVCRRERPARCPAAADAEVTFRKLRNELELAERLAGVIPGPRESVAERVRRLLVADGDTLWRSDTV